ncbi:MAG: pentapeptide repeat-containing protein [Planctomycetaceae bacterium]|nr:pentapeptide repeat-containing protein [Planctomycetaceae bacterium]
MRKILVIVVFFVFVLFLPFCILAAETLAGNGTAKHPADEVAFKLVYHEHNDSFKNGVVGKDISGNLIYSPDSDVTDHDIVDGRYGAMSVLVKPVTWGEFYNTTTYKNKLLIDVAIYADSKSFPISFAGWRLERVWFYSGFELKDAELSDCTIMGVNGWYEDLASKRLIAREEIPLNNKPFELFASTKNYQRSFIGKVSLLNFDLRKASFANKNISSMTIRGIMHDKNHPNIDLFDNATIHTSLPVGISKEQLYRTADYRNKCLSGTRWEYYGSEEQFDLSGQNLSNANMHSLFVRGENKMNFTDAVIRGAYLGIYDIAGGISREMVYSTKSYKTGDLTGIRFDNGIDTSRIRPIIGNMRNWNLSNQNLSHCRFGRVDLAGVDFTNSIITGVEFGSDVHNLTLDQIKSTWNYKNNRMDGIKLPDKIQKELDAENLKTRINVTKNQ